MSSFSRGVSNIFPLCTFHLSLFFLRLSGEMLLQRSELKDIFDSHLERSGFVFVVEVP